MNSTTPCCRLCQGSGGKLIRPCRCGGTIGYAHAACLAVWVNHNNSLTCEVCSGIYSIDIVLRHRCTSLYSWSGVQLVARYLFRSVADISCIVVKVVCFLALTVVLIPLLLATLAKVFHREMAEIMPAVSGNSTLLSIALYWLFGFGWFTLPLLAYGMWSAWVEWAFIHEGELSSLPAIPPPAERPGSHQAAMLASLTEGLPEADHESVFDNESLQGDALHPIHRRRADTDHEKNIALSTIREIVSPEGPPALRARNLAARGLFLYRVVGAFYGTLAIAIGGPRFVRLALETCSGSLRSTSLLQRCLLVMQSSMLWSGFQKSPYAAGLKGITVELCSFFEGSLQWRLIETVCVLILVPRVAMHAPTTAAIRRTASLMYIFVRGIGLTLISSAVLWQLHAVLLLAATMAFYSENDYVTPEHAHAYWPMLVKGNVAPFRCNPSTQGTVSFFSLMKAFGEGKDAFHSAWPEMTCPHLFDISTCGSAAALVQHDTTGFYLFYVNALLRALSRLAVSQINTAMSYPFALFAINVYYCMMLGWKWSLSRFPESCFHYIARFNVYAAVQHTLSGCCHILALGATYGYAALWIASRWNKSLFPLMIDELAWSNIAPVFGSVTMVPSYVACSRTAHHIVHDGLCWLFEIQEGDGGVRGWHNLSMEDTIRLLAMRLCFTAFSVMFYAFSLSVHIHLCSSSGFITALYFSTPIIPHCLSVVMLLGGRQVENIRHFPEWLLETVVDIMTWRWKLYGCVALVATPVIHNGSKQMGLKWTPMGASPYCSSVLAAQRTLKCRLQSEEGISEDLKRLLSCEEVIVQKEDARTLCNLLPSVLTCHLAVTLILIGSVVVWAPIAASQLLMPSARGILSWVAPQLGWHHGVTLPPCLEGVMLWLIGVCVVLVWVRYEERLLRTGIVTRCYEAVMHGIFHGGRAFLHYSVIPCVLRCGVWQTVAFVTTSLVPLNEDVGLLSASARIGLGVALIFMLHIRLPSVRREPNVFTHFDFPRLRRQRIPPNDPLVKEAQQHADGPLLGDLQPHNFVTVTLDSAFQRDVRYLHMEASAMANASHTGGSRRQQARRTISHLFSGIKQLTAEAKTKAESFFNRVAESENVLRVEFVNSTTQHNDT